MTVVASSTSAEDVDRSEDSTDLEGSVGRFRRYLPQFLASMSMYLLVFGLGMGVGFPTILIPVLTGLQTDKYPDETIHFTDVQASWYGSMLFLTEPLGSVCSGWINEQIGRKRSILLACVPIMAAWLLLYTAQSAAQIFSAGILLGFGSGLMVPVVTYIGEISEPSVRGMLLVLYMMSTMLGVFSTFVLGTWMSWRDAALVAFAMPVLAASAIFFVPETPQWLIARGRREAASKAMRWLRGWVSADQVDAELRELVDFIAVANACDECRRQAASSSGASIRCEHASSYAEKIRDLVRGKTLRPYALLLFCFFIVHSSGNMAIRPFLVQIFSTFGIPMDANWGLVVFGFIDIASNTFCVFAIPTFGKRPIMLSGLLLVAVSCFAVATDAFVTLPPGISSFDKESQVGVGENYVALASFVCLAVGASISGCVPWMLNSEVYPFRVRGTASGITSACSYVLIFVVTKTYLNVERGLSIGGGFVLYGCITAVGLVILYKLLPETEGRTLEEIEQFFSDKTRAITDRRIRKIVPQAQQQLEDEHVAHAAKRAKETVSSLDNPAFVAGV